jgi:hypothetical protein
MIAMTDPLDFSVSARGKPEALPMAHYLGEHFLGVPIRSVFGFREHTKLYGGRTFRMSEISEADIRWMYDHDVGYRIPLQSIQATYADYQESKGFLAKYHRPGNSVILVRHDLAEWIRQDFPDYEIEASVIHRVRSIDRLPRLSRLFDIIVLHPAMNDEIETLAAIADKTRIRLFANAGCLYKCPTMECYKGFSDNNRGKAVPFSCSQHRFPDYTRQVRFHSFDVNRLVSLGFARVRGE